MLRFNKAMLQDGAKRMNKWLKKGEGYPNWLKMTDMDKHKEYKLTPKQYNGLYENVNLFWIRNGRYPNYASLDHNATFNCLVYDPQNYNYSCASQSLSMASQILYNPKTENECIKALGTAPKVGTSPQQLIDNAPKLGFKIIPIERNAKSVKTQLKKFGHYGLIWRTTDTEYVVADPSKGVNRKYKFLCMDKVNRGYRQNYYAVAPK